MMKKGSLKKFKIGKNVFSIVGLVLLIVYTVSFLMPLVWAFFTSFREYLDFADDVFAFPEHFMLDNYRFVFKNMFVPVSRLGEIHMVELFYNSLIYTVLCTIMHTLTPMICAYAVAKFNFRFGKVIYAIVIVTMILPVVGNLASQIQVAKAVGFYDNVFGVAIMKGHFLGTNFLIFYASFKSLPNDFKEAAQIDGASQMRVFLSVVIPLIKTTIGAIALLSFITFWNDYTTAMIFLPSRPTVAYGLYYFTHSTNNEASYTTVQVAACMLVTIPIFLVFLIFRNKLVGNMAVGGIKG